MHNGTSINLTEVLLMNIKQSPLLSTSQVMEKTHLSKTSLWRKTKKGLFPSPVYLGTKKLWYQENIDTWLRGNLTTEPTHNNLEVQA